MTDRKHMPISDAEEARIQKMIASDPDAFAGNDEMAATFEGCFAAAEIELKLSFKKPSQVWRSDNILVSASRSVTGSPAAARVGTSCANQALNSVQATPSCTSWCDG